MTSGAALLSDELTVVVVVMVVLVAVSWAFRVGRQPQMPHPRATDLAGASRGRTRVLAAWAQGWRSLALLLLAMALAFPREERREVERHRGTRSLIVAVDVSRSMRAEDVGAGTRMEAARRELRGFVDRRQGDRVGVVAFGGRAMTVVPPTTDLGLVRRSVKKLKAGMLGDGTALGDALTLSVARLRGADSGSRVLVVLTDGASNSGEVTPERASRVARRLGVRIHAVSLGSGGRVPVRVRGEKGDFRRIRARLEVNEELLEEVAEITGGSYHRAGDRDGLAEVYAAIDSLERSPSPTVRAVHETSIRPWLPAAAAVALFLELAGTATRARWALGP